MSTAAVVVKSPEVSIPVPMQAEGPLTRERRDTIIVAHLPLVRAIAARVRENLPVQVELDDLVHAGVLGLFDAVEKFDASKGVVFHLYAKHRIRGAILDSLRQSTSKPSPRNSAASSGAARTKPSARPRWA